MCAGARRRAACADELGAVEERNTATLVCGEPLADDHRGPQLFGENLLCPSVLTEFGEVELGLMLFVTLPDQDEVPLAQS